MSTNDKKPELSQEEQLALAEYDRLIARYVPPHKLKSRRVTTVDISRVIADGQDLLAMCSLPRGIYKGIMALAHPQIDDKDPFRFFVLPNGLLVINPLIFNHTKVAVFKEEGCMTFPDKPQKTMLPRYHKITVKYQTLAQDKDTGEAKLSPFTTEELSGTNSEVMQHECGHLNGHYIYDEEFDPKWSIGLGDGLPLAPDTWDNEVIKE